MGNFTKIWRTGGKLVCCNDDSKIWQTGCKLFCCKDDGRCGDSSATDSDRAGKSNKDCGHRQNISSSVSGASDAWSGIGSFLKNMLGGNGLDMLGYAPDTIN